MAMFRRKSKNQVEGNVCPYCGFVNQEDDTVCNQCYYELDKSAREQGEPISQEVSSDIFDELMSEDDDDSWEEGEALEVILAVDEAPLEVEQYESTDFDTEEEEKVDFLPSRSPELTETKTHEHVEITEDDIGPMPTHEVPRMEFNNDPLAEVAEPVHTGKGSVYSPSNSKMDDDLMGHIGGEESSSIQSDDFYESKIKLTAMDAPPPPDIQPEVQVEVEKAPAPTPEMVLPELPDIDEVPDVETTEPIGEEIIETPAPPIQEDTRFWPWPAGEMWDPRKIHSEVVRALELSKAGKNDDAEVTIDLLGPHLSEQNIDLLYHVGMVLKSIGREEQVSWMLERAHSMMPENEHVTSALAHLKV